MRVRQAFERHYLAHRRLSPNTLSVYRSELRRWERYTADPPLHEITTETFERFRDSCRQHGLANDSTEGSIRVVTQLLRLCGPPSTNTPYGLGLIDRVPYGGHRLPLALPEPRFLPVEEIGRLYRHAGAARWPCLHVPTATFWRCWLVVSFFTGLRLSDQMYRVYWRNVSAGELRVRAGKTRKLHCFPMHPVLRNHLEMLRGDSSDPRVFPASRSPHLIRRGLREISEAAGIVPYVTPQHLRQTAATHWDLAKGGAGQKLQGMSLGVCDRYISVPAILRQAVRSLDIPQEFRCGDRAENAGGCDSANLLLAYFAKLRQCDRQVVVRLAERLVS